MRVRFKQKRLGEILNNRKKIIAKFGEDNAKKIMMRLQELESVSNLSYISTSPPPRLHRLKGERKNQFAVDVKPPFRIVFETATGALPYDEDGNVELRRITEIIIIEVVDYHD